MQAAARRQFGSYGQLPFYVQMFADAGFPVAANGSLSDALIDSLVVLAMKPPLLVRLADLLAQGLDELLVVPLPVGAPQTSRHGWHGCSASTSPRVHHSFCRSGISSLQSATGCRNVISDSGSLSQAAFGRHGLD